jgi:hypothetical protein
MNQKLSEDFVKLANLVKGASIPPESARTIDWCIQQLPALYKQLAETYETRFSEKIIQLERGILGQLATEAKTQPDAEQLSLAIAGAFRDLHERHGFQSLDPRPKAEKKVAPRKASAKVRRVSE